VIASLFATKYIFLLIILPPLISSVIVGISGNYLGKTISHSLAIIGVAIATAMAYIVFYQVQVNNLYVNTDLYTWLTINNQTFTVGLLVDHLTSVMLVVVASVSLAVHIYTIGYMADEDGYSRFFSYISLFTFMMFMLVLANNFIQLFFGWEGVGLVSYLLIGFYFKRPSAISANLKAFLINRIGDFGFLLGIGLVLMYFGTLNYQQVFNQLPNFIDYQVTKYHFSLITCICVLLFIGAMGKSAQFPLHVWLPDSMEGPTPISALIHAATMVTAGIFMVARLSPLFNLAPTALTLIITAGGINCLFLGMLAIVQTDIKRVIAYSTLSQLGYMAVALGCGAYSIAIFHLMTHAFFKGLLFLGAGSVILAMHHEQDMTKMGGLAKYMPITYVTMLIGSLALAGIPPFAGFFSKDLILDSALTAYHAGLSGGLFAVITVYVSVIITGIYSFRLIILTFHGREHFRDFNNHHHSDRQHNNLQSSMNVGNTKNHQHTVHPQESPIVVTLPLIILAIASLLAGFLYVTVFANNQILNNSVINAPWYTNDIGIHPIAPLHMIIDGFTKLPVYLSLFGIILAFIFYKNATFRDSILNNTKLIRYILHRNYYMDDIYLKLLAPLGIHLGKFLWTIGDMILIDGIIVNGSAKLVGWYSSILRKIQSGYVNSYATFMVVGIILLLTFCTKLILG
jgi:NADH-quinone oxidoreductase subunit L